MEGDAMGTAIDLNPTPVQICRFVHYRETADCRPALVVAVRNDQLNVTVFPGETASPYLVRRVEQGQDTRNWHWPTDCAHPMLFNPVTGCTEFRSA